MKKLLIMLVAALLIGITASSQKISEFYENEIIELEAIQGYGDQNNWDEVFALPIDPSFAKDLGKRKRIVVAPDGSVFMSHKTPHEIWKFNKDGNLVRKIGKKGNKPGEFVMLPTVEGIFAKKYVYTNDIHGRMQFYDFEGNYIKNLKLDYMPLDSRPLKDNKIAILGYVPWKNNITKYIIAIKDFDSGEEKIIWTLMKDRDKGIMTVNTSEGHLMSFTIANNHSSFSLPRMATSKSGNLIIANPLDGNVTIYSPQGKKVNSFDLNIKAHKIGKEEIDGYYKAGVKNLEKLEGRLRNSGRYNEQEIDEMVLQYKKEVEKLKNKDQYPEHLPFFTNLIVDSEGNMLIFEYTEKHQSNKFRVYSYDTNGKYLSSSSFASEQYKLNFAPSAFVFHNNYLFNVAEKREGTGNLMRLVKLKAVK